MKQFLLLFGLFLSFSLFAQDDDDGYVMFEINYLHPDIQKYEGLWEKIGAHNKAYHGEGPYRAKMWTVVNGPRTGQIVYSMGPLTFSDLDNRPSGEGHDKDWAGVMPHMKKGGETSYWRMNKDLSYSPNQDSYKKVRLRFISVKPFRYYRMKGILEKIHEVVKTKYPNNPWQVFNNPMWTKDAPYLAVVSSFNDWSWMDQDGTFWKDYESVHGEGSWLTFMREWEDTVDDAYDEYWQSVPEASTR